MLLAAGAALGQPTVSFSTPKSQLLRAGRATVLAFGDPDRQPNFRITLGPEARVQPTATSGVYLVNGQQLVVRASSAVAVTATDTAALRIFARADQQRFLSTTPSGLVRPFERQFVDKATSRPCFVWGFDMPTALDKTLDGVVYLYFCANGYLVCLGSTQPKGQPLCTTLNALFAALQGYAPASTAR